MFAYGAQRENFDLVFGRICAEKVSILALR